MNNNNNNNSESNVNLIKEYEFTQYHLTDWPDHGVPENIEPIMSVLHLVRQKMSDLSKSNSKTHKSRHNSDYLAVHCSAGCGRTGTIIAIDQLWTLMLENV